MTATAYAASPLRRSGPAIARAVLPEFPPCEPESESAVESKKRWDGYERPGDRMPASLPDLDFCSEWNPEFPFNGHHCCRNLASTHRRRARVGCFIHRPRGSYCGEMTEEQKEYKDDVLTGKYPDVLQLINQDLASQQEQSYCTVNNGFLAYGRPVIPSDKNRIEIRSPGRCTNFGTDSMVGMLEWVGRQVSELYSDSRYSKVRLLIGDIAAPRGGCLSGSSGRRGHLSHTNGQDVDVGYLIARPNARSPESFSTEFDARTNWWLAKEIFHNPYACVKAVFLDRRNIRKLAKAAAGDPEWARYGRFFRHVPGHRNHMHVRIGEGPGLPGCRPDARPELEPTDEGETDVAVRPGGGATDSVSSSQSSQSTDIQE